MARDKDKTKAELTQELENLCQRVAELEAAEAKHKRVVETLRESEKKYRGIFNNVPTSIILLDKDGQIVDINPYHVTHIGKGKTTPKDYLGKSLITHPSIVNAGLSETYAGLLKGEAFDLKGVHFPTTTGGTDAYFNVKGVPIFKEGKVTAAIAMHEDITERKRAEESLKAAEARYQDLYENAPDMYASVDPNTALILRCNQTVATNLGYTKREIVGRPIFDMYHPDCMDDVKRAFQSFVETGEVRDAELQLKRKDETKIDVSLNVSAVRDDQGNILYSRSAWRDITERKRAEEALKEAEAELRHTIEVVPGIIARANAHTGYFTHCNAALSSVLGFSSEEFLARPFMEFVHPDDRQSTINEVEKQLKGSPVARFENRYICKDGTYKWLEWRATTADEKGEVYAAATDITERKQAEKRINHLNLTLRSIRSINQLITREKDRGRLLKGICNTLVSILAAARMLGSSCSTSLKGCWRTLKPAWVRISHPCSSG